MNIFYNTNKLNLIAKKKILEDAKKKSWEWWADRLDNLGFFADDDLEIFYSYKYGST